MDVAVGKSKWLRVSTLAASIAMLVSACGTSAPATSEVKNGGTLIFALDSDATTLNPFVMSTVPEFRALSFMYPNLYAADKNLNVIPDLADGMPSVSSDGTVWTVKLKKTGKWSDGTPMTADDVLATQTVTGGPYKFDKWVPGQEIDFSANLSYYNGRPHYDKVIAKIITDATAAANALINGDVSWHPSLGEAGAGGISKAKAASNVVVYTYQDPGDIDFRMKN